MLNLIKQLFRKKEKYTPPVKPVNAFLLDRPNDWIRLTDYYNNRFDGNGFYRLNVEMGLIIPINLENNSQFEEYIAYHFFSLREDMVLKERTFIKDLRELSLPYNLNLTYYFPFVSSIDSQILKNTNIKTLLNFIGYNGEIKTGFLSFTGTGATFIGLKENESVEEFVKGYIDNLQVLNYNDNRKIFYSLRKTIKSDEPNIELDDETKAILNQIEDNIIKLKQSGQFFLVAPRLEQIIAQVTKQNNENIILSDVIIDEEFRIILPYYGNTEITLSHLTKAIYILFLKHPEGILLSELALYEVELFLIYQNISYQASFDKMKNSVRELIADDKAIFVHFSRIKSAFVKNFTDFYAEYYYIQGAKGGVKYIKLDREKVIFKLPI